MIFVLLAFSFTCKNKSICIYIYILNLLDFIGRFAYIAYQYHTNSIPAMVLVLDFAPSLPTLTRKRAVGLLRQAPLRMFASASMTLT